MTAFFANSATFNKLINWPLKTVFLLGASVLWAQTRKCNPLSHNVFSFLYCLTQELKEGRLITPLVLLGMNLNRKWGPHRLTTASLLGHVLSINTNVLFTQPHTQPVSCYANICWCILFPTKFKLIIEDSVKWNLEKGNQDFEYVSMYDATAFTGGLAPKKIWNWNDPCPENKSVSDWPERLQMCTVCAHKYWTYHKRHQNQRFLHRGKRMDESSP